MYVDLTHALGGRERVVSYRHEKHLKARLKENTSEEAMEKYSRTHVNVY